MKTAGVFETPLFMCQIEGHERWVELAHKELKNLADGSEYVLKENDHTDQLRHTVRDGAFENSAGGLAPKKWLNRPGWEPLREQIRHHLSEAYAKFFGDDYMDGQRALITDSWVNVCDAGGFQFFHSHANAVLSWTYFMNLKPEEGHAQLAFNRPDISTRPFFALPQGGTGYTCQLAQPDCREGQLLMWPGHLIHGYKENEADGRMTMSGNSVPSVIRNNGYVLKIEEE